MHNSSGTILYPVLNLVFIKNEDIWLSWLSGLSSDFAAQLLDPWDDFDRVFGQFPGICHAVSCPMYPGAGVPVRYQILVGLLPKLSGP